MDALSPRHQPEAGLRRGADHIASDAAGQNFYAIDRGLRDLLAHYLSPADLQNLEPHFDRLGALAGGRLDELARQADKHPPVLHPRDRFGRDEDWIDYHASYREMFARLVLEHRLSAQDPLAPNEATWEREAAEVLLAERCVSLDEIAKLLI